MTTTSKHIAVIGGGIMGVTLAYRLAQAGVRATVYERSPHLGGLAGFMEFEGARIDRFYHTILSSDMSMQSLIKETGVENKLHFTETKQGFYDKSKLYPFNTPVDFLLFPPLNLFQRFRLGLQIITAQFSSDWRTMDTIPVEKWLRRVSGRGAFRKVWLPLLRAKFDSYPVDQIPATYIWSRLKRMMSTRQGVTSKEMMCYLENGYYTLVEAIAAAAEKLGASIHVNAAVEEIVIENGRAIGLRRAGEVERFDGVISTLHTPILAEILPAAPPDFRAALKGQDYLGVLCPLIISKARLTPYYVVNITDESVPFTAVVETTNLIDPKHVKENHLIYLPKYITPESELATWDDEKVRAEWMKHFKKMFPDFDEGNIKAFVVQRARYVEPLRPLNTSEAIPPVKSPVAGLYLSNTVMVYPDLNNGEAVTKLATQVVKEVLADLTVGN